MFLIMKAIHHVNYKLNRHNSSVSAMGLHLHCINPWILDMSLPPYLCFVGYTRLVYGTVSCQKCLIRDLCGREQGMTFSYMSFHMGSWWQLCTAWNKMIVYTFYMFTENFELLWCQLCHCWWHQRLPPVITKLASWELSVFTIITCYNYVILMYMHDSCWCAIGNWETLGQSHSDLINSLSLSDAYMW